MKYLLAAILFSGFSWAAHFGQNKVQVERSQWSKIQTTHFDIYFDQHGQNLAKWTAQNVEDCYNQVSQSLGHQVFARIPIILHNSPNHFRSTNVIPEALPEAVGGFTEIFQNRIVLPFSGSYNEFRHVLQHEMVHAFMFDLFKGDGGSGGMRLAYKMSDVPLWFSEGLAEYFSMGQDLESEPYLVDGMSFGYLAPPGPGLDGYMAYRGGQNFLVFLEESYGQGTIRKVIKELRRGRSIEGAVGIVTGVKLDDLGEIWLRELRRIYWPELGTRSYAKEVAQTLTQFQKTESFVNLSPSLSPDGKHLVFGSDQGGFEGIYGAALDSLNQIQDMKKLVQNAWSGEHESVHLFFSGYAWSPDGKKIVMVSQSAGQDELQILSYPKGQVLQKLALGFDMIRNPDWSKDGRYLVFSALKNGAQDLYLLEIATKKMTQLTFGFDAEDRPKFNHQGDKILFESNAGFVNKGQGMGIKDHFQIYTMDLGTKSIHNLLKSSWNLAQAEWGAGDSSVYYMSNESGLNQIYLKNLYNDSLWQMTNLLSNVNSYTLDSAGQKVVFSLFEGGMFQLYLNPQVNSLKKPIQVGSTRFASQWLRQDHTPLFQKRALGYLEKWQDEDRKTDSCRLIESSNLRQQCFDSTWNPRYLSLDSAEQNLKQSARRKVLDSLFNQEVKLPALDSVGNLQIQPYETQWSMDQVWLAAGGAYAGSNQYAVGGQAYMHFSDLMGDQGITAMLYGAGTDMREISAYLNYAYLPYRNDYTASMWYTPSRQQSLVWLDTNGRVRRGDSFYSQVEQVKIRDSNYCIWYENGQIKDTTNPTHSGQCVRYDSFLDRDYGASLELSHPFSRFSRVDLKGGVSFLQRTKQEPYCTDRYCENISYEDSPVTDLLIPRVHLGLEYDFDNTRWGWTGPVAGGRSYFQNRLIKSMDGKEQFGVSQFDLRKYYYLGSGFSIALKGSAGVSYELGGENSFRFYMGGDDFFDLNYQVDLSQFQGNLRESYSSEIVAPLRGFPYYHFRGDRYALGNAEFRFPLIEEIRLGILPMSLGGIMGNLFYDVGSAWNAGENMEQAAWSWGFGWRVNLGVFVLRYSKAYGSYFKYTNKRMQSHWSLGADF